MGSNAKIASAEKDDFEAAALGLLSNALEPMQKHSLPKYPRPV
jgi:hypothetical protein